MFRNIRNLGNQIRIDLPTDENGLTSRECPTCQSVFKLKFGTGLMEDNLPCHCPYCGTIASQDQFFTQDQIEYVQSIIGRKVNQALQNDLKDWGRQIERSSRNSLIKLKVSVNSSYKPIHYYQEKQLETNITCDNCSLEYAIYGVFAYCPDCGTHNSYQILQKNIELVQKEINMSNGIDDNELAEHLIKDGLENLVSAFDGFGRATCSAFSSKSSDENQANEVSFQNIVNARNRVQTLFGIDFGATISNTEWDSIVRCFQKRHLLAHKMGVIDEEYLKRTNDPTAHLGRKVTISEDEVIELSRLFKIIGKDLYDKLKI